MEYFGVAERTNKRQRTKATVNRDSETAAVCVQPINVIILKEQSCVIKSFWMVWDLRMGGARRGGGAEGQHWIWEGLFVDYRVTELTTTFPVSLEFLQRINFGYELMSRELALIRNGRHSKGRGYLYLYVYLYINMNIWYIRIPFTFVPYLSRYFMCLPEPLNILLNTRRLDPLHPSAPLLNWLGLTRLLSTAHLRAQHSHYGNSVSFITFARCVAI